MSEFAELLSSRVDTRSSRALAEAVSGVVGEGLVPPGTLLPPIRRLAAELGVSASTVSSAWEMLARAGVIRTDGRRGTSVTRRDPPGPIRYRRALRQSSGALVDLSSGVPDASLLPDLEIALRQVSTSLAPPYLDDPLLPELGEVLRAQWPYDAPAMTVVDGAMDAVDQTLGLLVRMGDRVMVEHPTFPPFLDLLDAMGATIVPVPLDREGMVPAHLDRAIRSGAKVLLCQPRSHNPTGVSTSPRRIDDLAHVLGQWTGWIVEDDSAGAISHVAPTSLGRWHPHRTVHIRSFSKSHGPDLRLAALSGPEEFVGRLVDRRLLGQGWTSRLLQSLLLDLLTRPSSQAQVARARDHYERRRARLVIELARRGLEVMGTDGINVWLPVHDETAALLSLASRGIAVAAGGPFESADDPQHHVRVTTSTLSTDVEELAAHLADAALARPAWGPR